MSVPRIIRVLYVKGDIDEKESAERLEEAVKRKVKKPAMVFTCVTSSLMAVECAKSANFDVIILEEKLSDFGGTELLNILYTNHYYVSPIFLVKRDELGLAQLRLSGHKYPVKVLADPFSDFELCCMIRDSLMNRKINLHFHQTRRVIPPPPAHSALPETAEYPPIRQRSVREELADRQSRLEISVPYPPPKRIRAESVGSEPSVLSNYEYSSHHHPQMQVYSTANPPLDYLPDSSPDTQETATDDDFGDILNLLEEEEDFSLYSHLQA